MNDFFKLGFRMKLCDFYQFDTSRIDLLMFSVQCKIVNKKKAIDNNVMHDTIFFAIDFISTCIFNVQ